MPGHQGHLEYFAMDDIESLLKPDFDILEERSIGYLFGMHALTKRVPLPVGPLRLLNRGVNSLFRVIAPRGGHIFFMSALRKGTLPVAGAANFRSPFRCPKCQADLTFGVATCSACGLALPYGESGYLDYMKINPQLKSIVSS